MRGLSRNLAPFFWCLIVFVLSLAYQFYKLKVLLYALPPILYIVPFMAKKKPATRLTLDDLRLAAITTVLFVAPFISAKLFFLRGSLALPTDYIQLAGMLIFSYGEELFFRGYVQGSMKNRWSSVLIASVMFALCHIGGFVADGDMGSLFAIFPSLVMGWLFMRTLNVTAPALFHIIANVAYTLVR